MSARDTVLSKIRRSLGVTGEEPRRNATVDSRLGQAAKGVIPARGQLPGAERLALFIKMAEAVKASITRVADEGKIPEAIAGYLRAHNLPAAVRMGDDPLLTALPWAKTTISVQRGPAVETDTTGVSHATAGVAETGTLVLTSGKDNPTSVNFLPETHVVVVKAADIAGDYEAVWAKLRAEFGKGALPRTVNWITGPSRSGDIEQTILLGAHGPRRLHIVVVG